MRGFSLFTPLVGTALVIMSILVATTLIENDVRFSRSISNSFAVSSQIMGAKLIRAAATVKIVDNIKDVVYRRLTEITYGIECTSKTECIRKMKDALTSIGLQSDIAHEAFYVTETIIRTTGYSPLPSSCGDPCDNPYLYPEVSDRIDCCLVAAMRDTIEAVEIDFDSDDRLEVKIQTQLLEEREEFIVGFSDTLGNTLYLSIAPPTMPSVKTSEKILEMIKNTAEAFESGGCDILRPKGRYLGCEGSVAEGRLKADWSLGEPGNLRTFSIEFMKPQSSSGSP